MTKQLNFDITIGTSYLPSFENNNLKTYEAFREFIDNSLQSYLDHREELDALANSPKKCIVKITWDEGEICIEDNSFGMDEEAFGRAMKLGSLPPNSDSPDRLSRYGVGLKSAAYHISRAFTISSVALNSGKMIKCDIDTDFLKKNNPNSLRGEVSDGLLPTTHWTKIELKRLNENSRIKNGHKSAVQKVAKALADIYKFYLADKLLEISLNGNVIQDDDPRYYQVEGIEKCETVDRSSLGFEFEGKRYKYIANLGVLEQGDSKGETTGLTFYQARRAISLHQYPDSLFGGSNDFRRQRVCGFVLLFGNEWRITNNKNEIDWGDGRLLDAFINDLLGVKEVRDGIFKFAKELRVTKKNNLSSLIRSMGQDGIKPSESSSVKIRKDESGKDATNDGSDSKQPTTASFINHPVKSATSERPKQRQDDQVESAMVTYKNQSYQLKIVLRDGEESERFVKVENVDDENFLCSVTINKNANFIKKYTTNDKGLYLAIAFAETWAVVKKTFDLSSTIDLQLVEDSINDFLENAK